MSSKRQLPARSQTWLRTTFDSKAKLPIRSEWHVDANEQRAQGLPPKAWAKFLADFKDACIELGIAA